MVGEKFKHFLNSNGTRKGCKSHVDLPTANTFGPNGLVSMVSNLTDKEWDTQEDEKEKEYAMELDLSGHMKVFEKEHSIRDTKVGKFSILTSKLGITLKKKNGKVQKQQKVRINIEAEIRGQIKRADGTWMWMRSD